MSLQVPANQQGIRHAILHDFCMSIPFGSIVLAAGVVSLLFGSGKQGLSFASAGTGILAASFFSLVQWRAQRPSTMFTLLSAGKCLLRYIRDNCTLLAMRLCLLICRDVELGSNAHVVRNDCNECKSCRLIDFHSTKPAHMYAYMSLD